MEFTNFSWLFGFAVVKSVVVIAQETYLCTINLYEGRFNTKKKKQ